MTYRPRGNPDRNREIAMELARENQHTMRLAEKLRLDIIERRPAEKKFGVQGAAEVIFAIQRLLLGIDSEEILP